MDGLTVPAGTHKVDVLLLRPNGQTRETKAIDLSLDRAAPQTLRIRLSRFKRDLQLTTVAGVPEAGASESDAATK